MDRPEWVSFYEMGDPRGLEFLGRNTGGGVEVEVDATTLPEVNHVEGSLLEGAIVGVAVIKQAVIVDSPVYLQVRALVAPLTPTVIILPSTSPKLLTLTLTFFFRVCC